jgi:hypothetical protein
MDGTCKTQGKLNMQRKVWSQILKEKDHFEELDVEGVMLTLILNKQGDNCGLDSSASGYWQALVNTVMNVQVPYLRGISELIPSSQEEFCSMESEPFTEIS